MSKRLAHSRRTRVSPIVYILIPLAFFLGLGGGYLLWGGKQGTASAGSDNLRRVSVSTDNDPSIGPAKAPITIIEFSDYQCPYCQSWYQQVYQPLMAAYPNKIRFVYRDMPLVSIHPEAMAAAEAADCAGEQNAYWQYHDALFGRQYGLGGEAYVKYATDLGLNLQAFTACLDSQKYQAEVQADANDAARVGIDSTPTFVVNGIVIVGAQPLDAFQTVINQILQGKQ